MNTIMFAADVFLHLTPFIAVVMVVVSFWALRTPGNDGAGKPE